MNEKANKRSEPKFTGQVKMYPISCRPECQPEEKTGEIEGILKHNIAVSKASADNENYCCGLSIKEAQQALTYIEQLQAEIKGLKEIIIRSIDGCEGLMLVATKESEADLSAIKKTLEQVYER